MIEVKRSLFFITLPLCTIGCFAFAGTVRAQIIQDNTLPGESSVVSPNLEVINGTPSQEITGGATRGANLFHSFQEFNIGENRGAYFVQPSGIQNIISRVTGRNLSNINGILGVILGNGNLGNANLFLINPNGIEFGPNARLNMGGSFLASTANSLILDNGLLEFSATNPQAPPLLTVNIPTGLRFRDNAGSITNQSRVQNVNGNLVGLELLEGKSLALVGGNVTLNGGILTAP